MTVSSNDHGDATVTLMPQGSDIASKDPRTQQQTLHAVAHTHGFDQRPLPPKCRSSSSFSKRKSKSAHGRRHGSLLRRTIRNNGKLHNPYWKKNIASPMFAKYQLAIRRARRHLRPLVPHFARALLFLSIVLDVSFLAGPLFAAAKTDEFGHVVDSVHVDDLDYLHLLDILAALVGMISALGFITIKADQSCSQSIFLFQAYSAGRKLQDGANLAQLLLRALWSLTSTRFIRLIGKRRRLRSNAHDGTARFRPYTKPINEVLEADFYEIALRYQATILLLDFSLGLVRLQWLAVLLLCPLLVGLVLGFMVHVSGWIAAIALCIFACTSHPSRFLQFGLQETLSTIAGLVLASAVGPGLFSVDETMSRSERLIY